MFYKDGIPILSRKALTSYDHLTVSRDLLNDTPPGPVMDTGYGRHLVKEYLQFPVSMVAPDGNEVEVPKK